MSEPKETKQLLENIASKINNSEAVNGKMFVMMEHIQEKQQETSEHITKIHDGLYDPDEGLYARVKMVETATKEFSDKHAEHIQNDEENMGQINSSLKKLTEVDVDLTKRSETTTKLKRIAGEDLEKLRSVLETKTMFQTILSKAVWLIVGGILAALGKTIYNLLAK